MVEMKPSVAWLLRMINSRCRHWYNNDYPGWWACYFDYKSSGLRGSTWEGFGSSGGFANPSFFPFQRVMCSLWTGKLITTRCSHTPVPKLALPTNKKSWKRRHSIFIIWKVGPTSSSFTKTGNRVCFYSSLYTWCFAWINEAFSRPWNILSQRISSSFA